MKVNRWIDIWTIMVGIMALLTLQSAAAESAPQSTGTSAYQAQNYPQAFKLLSVEAKAGDSEAQYLLGTLYIDGLGVKKSMKQGVHWLKSAVKQRHAVAAHMLGKIYMSGMGVPIDIDKGIHYMELADQFTPDEEEEECD